jgi:hypothetical protein
MKISVRVWSGWLLTGDSCARTSIISVLLGRRIGSLKTTILDGDWTFITNNGVDFRGSAKKPGSQGVYADVPLHAGLVCVDAPGGLNLETQKRLFDLVLSNLEEGGTLTNQVLQVTLSPDGSVELARYGMPA